MIQSPCPRRAHFPRKQVAVAALTILLLTPCGIVGQSAQKNFDLRCPQLVRIEFKKWIYANQSQDESGVQSAQCGSTLFLSSGDPTIFISWVEDANSVGAKKWNGCGLASPENPEAWSEPGTPSRTFGDITTMGIPASAGFRFGSSKRMVRVSVSAQDRAAEMLPAAREWFRKIEPRAAPCTGATDSPQEGELIESVGSYHEKYSAAKRHLCDFAVNLGQAAAREYLYGTHYGKFWAETPDDQVATIGIHLKDAAAHLAAAEGLLEAPFGTQPSRANPIAQTLTSLGDYMKWRAERRPDHRSNQLENIWNQYQQTFAYTFVSSRPDAFQYKATCDSKILDYCYHFGRALIAAEISPADRQGIRADSYQGGANSSMSNAVFTGLELAMDGRAARPPGEMSTDRVCCALGPPAAWYALPKFQSDSSKATYAGAKKALDSLLDRAKLPPNRCRLPIGTDCCEPDAEDDPGSHPGGPPGDVFGEDPGLIFGEGLGLLGQDPQKAFRLIHSAAEQGHVQAQTRLGSLYFNGEGTPRHYGQASLWWHKAAVSGDRTAQFALGTNYEEGRGVPKDDSEAVRWYREAAEQGHPRAQNNLGAFHATGRGVPRDEVKAVYWYRKSADQGSAMAQSNLGSKYEHGTGVAKDYSEAVYWYRKSAEQEHAGGQRGLGYMYQRGLGVDRDYAEALRLYRLSADQGNADSHNDLGVMYEMGWGVGRDYSEARRWYVRAADGGLASGWKNLGDLYLNGLGVGKDRGKAIEYYRKAARGGWKSAQRWLRENGLSW